MGSKANALYTSTGKPGAGSFGRSGDLVAEFDLIEEGFYRLQKRYVHGYMADANTAQTLVLINPVQWSGTLTRCFAMNHANNAGAATVYTLATSHGSVTVPTWEHEVGDVSDTKRVVVPTNNAGVNGDIKIEIISDGGGSSVMPVSFYVEITLE